MADPRVVGEAHQLLDQPLAAVVGRVRLARDHDLDRPFGVEQQVHQPVAVAQHQGQPLVRGDPAGEADGQDVGVEHPVDPAQFGRPGAALPPGGAQPFPYLHAPAVRAGTARSSQMSWSAMSATASHRSEPPTVSASSVRSAPIWRAPSRNTSGATQVGAWTPLVTEVIGTSSGSKPGQSPANISRLTWPCSRETPLARWAEPQAHHGHVEEVRARRRGRSPCRGCRTRSTSIRGSSASGPKWRATSSRSKRSMPAGTGVWVVKTVPARTASSAGVEVQPLVAEFGDAFQAEEAGVALVGVEHLGGGVAGEPAVRADRAHSSYAEQHLLEQPVLAAAAVQPVGDPAFAEVVLLDVGVEQQQRYAADLGEPDPGAQRAAAGQGEGDLGGGAVGLPEQGDGQFVGVEDRIVLLLPAVPGEGLAEVAVPVEQADADERYAEVAGRLQMVAGEDAEAAGVLRQGGRDAELGGEVGDGGGAARRPGCAGPGTSGRRSRSRAGRRRPSVEPAQEAAVLGQLGEPRGATRCRAAVRGRRRRRPSARGRRTGRGRGSPHARTSAGCGPGH